MEVQAKILKVEAEIEEVKATILKGEAKVEEREAEIEELQAKLYKGAAKHPNETDESLNALLTSKESNLNKRMIDLTEIRKYLGQLQAEKLLFLGQQQGNVYACVHTFIVCYVLIYLFCSCKGKLAVLVPRVYHAFLVLAAISQVVKVNQEMLLLFQLINQLEGQFVQITCHLYPVHRVRSILNQRG